MSIFYEHGAASAPIILIQPVAEHDPDGMERELRAIRQLTSQDFRLVAVKVERWNHDLSPWAAPAVFRGEDFGSGAAGALGEISAFCDDKDLRYFIGGYSLAGLFSLWAACQTDRFTGAAAASPSVWFPGFVDYLRAHPLRSRAVYLSLGDREEKTRNPLLASVGGCIRECYDLIRAQNADCTLEWNPGNHFQDPDLRTAKAFAWLMNTQRSE